MKNQWKSKYWDQLRAYLQQEGLHLQARCPGKGDRARLQAFEMGRSTFFLEAWFSTKYQEIGVRFRMAGKYGPARFHALKEHREVIARELGETPKWRECPVDVSDETDWSNQHAWHASKLKKFNAVFRPRIESLVSFKE